MWQGKSIHGRICKDRVTKLLTQRIRPGDIALVEHEDLDWVAAEALLRRGVRAVLNTRRFCSGQFPPAGLQLLMQNKVHLVENLDSSLFNLLQEGDLITVNGGAVLYNRKTLACGEVVTGEKFNRYYRQVAAAGTEVIDKFVMNTLRYAYREKSLVTGKISIPAVRTRFKKRHAVVVVRGKGYRDDLRAIKSYLLEKKPVLIGVDGGGDALLEYGLVPDIIVGDMDSVSDRALKKAKELVVHAYHDGRGVPGEKRLQQLGLSYQIFAAPGTSEDIALLMAYELGSELVVAVGTHTSVNEFLEKGRKGMSSTFLVRLKVGDRLVDAKGVSRLYTARLPLLYIPIMIMAGLLPVLFLAVFSPLVQHLFRLLMFRLRFFP